MRRDIDKVVFERAKAGRTWASKTPRPNRVALDPAGEPLDERTGPVRRKRQKMRNSHYNAVERFLVRNVGRPWAKVYAEICAAADGRTRLGREIRDHAESLVATRCWFEGAKLMSHSLCGPDREARGLYVHPASGLLSRTLITDSASGPRA
jgi:hypothetical protein